MITNVTQFILMYKHELESWKTTLETIYKYFGKPWSSILYQNVWLAI